MRSKDDFVYIFDLGSIDKCFPRQTKREEMRRWCNESLETSFRIRWNQETGRLTVAFREMNAAFMFKMRYSDDVIAESRPPVRQTADAA